MTSRARAAVLAFFLCSPIFAQQSFFWGTPEAFSPGRGSFPQTASCADFSLIAWQESEALEGGGNVYISFATRSESEKDWSIKSRIAGPYSFSGDEPVIFSVLIDDTGRIFIIVAASPERTDIYCVENRGESSRRYTLNTQGASSGSFSNGRLPDETLAGGRDALVPKLFQMSDGRYTLFVVRSAPSSISLYYAESDDGFGWSSFRPFVTDRGMFFNFLPVHLTLNGQDVIVFQSFITGSSSSAYQLFMKKSTDSGKSWSAARRITMFADPFMNVSADPDNFNNERPHISEFESKIFLVWERRYGSGSPSIYALLLNEDALSMSPPERVNSAFVYCNNPVGFVYNGERHVLWFDNRRGTNGAVMADRTARDWENRPMAERSAPAIFPRVLVSGSGNGIYIFWQEESDAGNRIVLLPSDKSVAAPEVIPLNFKAGARASQDRARVEWEVPYDTSGIEGFSWSWSRDPDVEPAERRIAWAGTRNLSFYASEDGPWYFKIKALDFAGNWSPSGSVVFVRDMTPPEPVNVILPENDAGGFLPSNSFTLRWRPPRDKDLEGYYYRLDYLGPSGPATRLPATSVPVPATQAVRVMGNANRVHYENRDDGLWRFIIYPIDDVGNIGAGRASYFKLNKYIPKTFITYVDYEQELMGDVDITIIGRGFSSLGNIERVIFTREDTGIEERVIDYSSGKYRIDGDRQISVRRIENLQAGIYYIDVEHPLRGRARSPHTITIGRSLTYKFGDYDNRLWEPEWFVSLRNVLVFDIWKAVFALVLAFCIVLLVLTVRGAVMTVTEGAALRIETIALLYGNEMPHTKKQQLKALQRRGMGLRFKLASFTVALVCIVIVMVSVPLYVMMSSTQQRTLMRSLWERSSVLMESVTSGARTFLPPGGDGLPNVLELGFLPAQSSAVNEARYITITGFASKSSLTSDYIWATNDEEIEKKINTPVYEQGVSRIEDKVSERIAALQNELNNRAREAANQIAESIAELNREGMRLAALDTDEARRQIENLDITRRTLDIRITTVFNEIASVIYSEPEFNQDTAEAKNAEYILFKPVIFRQSDSDIYVRGWVRIEISSESIVRVIADERLKILLTIIYIALAAILLGGILSFVLATFIVLPLRSLVGYVELIRDTENITEFAGKHIVKKSSDEIGVLSDTINEMVEGLVKAALASQDLSIGKEIQKKFIPLELDARGNKLTSGYKITKYVEFFGYYEGAKGVSGDYFDYRDLDGRYYAVIKCDVAGKGIPAALIMIQVATMFINYFRKWVPTDRGMRIEDLVYQINTFIEEMAFKGRFAAFTLCIFDSHTGIARFCNAGDNVIHYYDASDRKMKMITLKQTPAAGVLPTMLVEMKGGYQMHEFTLDPGDILLLYTDGIEEGKRIFRNSDFEPILCNYNNAPRDTPHGNHVVGQDGEEFSPERVDKIANAVMRRGTFELLKYHNPHGNNTKYHFDFSACDGTVEDLIMALISIEKLFRMWKNHESRGTRTIVDKKIDAFLHRHFIEYDTYCSESAEFPENPEYMYYVNMNEDEQYDDLTVLGIRRK